MIFIFLFLIYHLFKNISNILIFKYLKNTQINPFNVKVKKLK